MRQVSMIAARPMTYQTRQLVPGEPFACDILFALIAKRRGHALLKEDAEARAKSSRQRYLNRELTAER